MKKLISVILICAMLCTLCACGNPCAKGHSYVASEEGCKCERCGEVIGHSLTPTEDGCLCEVCGELKAHTFITEEEHCVCEVCGFATAEHELESKPGKFVCSNCGEEVSKRDYLINYMREKGEVDSSNNPNISYSTDVAKYRIQYDEDKQALICIFKSLVPDVDTAVSFENTNEGSEYFGTSTYYFRLETETVVGSFITNDYIKGMNLPDGICAYSNSLSSEIEKPLITLSSFYVGVCIDGVKLVLDHYDLDITLADLGFVNFK